MDWLIVRIQNAVRASNVKNPNSAIQFQPPLIFFFENSHQHLQPPFMKECVSSLKTRGFRAMPRKLASMKGRECNLLWMCQCLSVFAFSGKISETGSQTIWILTFSQSFNFFKKSPNYKYNGICRFGEGVLLMFKLAKLTHFYLICLM